MCGYVVPSAGYQNQESWRLLVKERITKLAKLRILFFLLSAINVFQFFLSDFLVLSWQTSLLCTVGGVRRGWVCRLLALVRGVRGQLICDSKQVVLLAIVS